VLDADVVLGLDLHRVWEQAPTGHPAAVPDDVSALVAERTSARTERDFARSDEIRDELGRLGWEVIDGVDGSTVRRRA
jgi:cysteinyl-tRNA synthetase